jgi:Fe2+ or Zn2+ uptake regulation protein
MRFMNTEIIFENIRLKGGRITKVRGEVINLLAKEECLMSRADILGKLDKLKMKPDRSTIFRELNFLVNNNFLIRNTISGVDYYEIPGCHHHHLICLGCKLIKKVDMEKHLEDQEKVIARENKFNILTHSLDFYGYCNKCKI